MSLDPMIILFKSEAASALQEVAKLINDNPQTTAINSEIITNLGAMRAAAMLAGLETFLTITDNWKKFCNECAETKILTQELAPKVKKLLERCANDADTMADINADDFIITAQQVATAGDSEMATHDATEKAGSSSNVTDPKNETTEPSTSETKTALPKIEIDPMMLDMFNAEAEERIQALTTHIMGLEENPADSISLENLMRAAHSLKGAARIIGLTPVTELSHALEDYFVAAQNGKITVCSDVADILLKTVDGLARLCKLEENDPQPYIGQLAVIKSNDPCSASQPQSTINAPTANCAFKVHNDNTPEPETQTPQPESSAKTEAPEDTAETKAQADNTTVNAPRSGKQDQTIRVAVSNINRIMGLAGETIVQAQNIEPLAQSLHYLKARHDRLHESLRNIESLYKGEDNPATVLLEQLRQDINACSNIIQSRIDEFDSISRNASELSERLYNEVLSSRMRPFSEGVQGFYRMVRDLSRELGKRVKFQVIGKETKVDRDVLNKLESPLTHLLRNSIDHGLQSPEERENAGKHPENNLTLQALHWAGFLNVRVIDDGRGIDVEKVRSKIREKGLHEESSINELTEQEVLEFLFLPGFSTASKVSEISGRGVGLDIVRDMLHELGGNVNIENRPGRGVSFHLRLPVTRSVARVLLIEIGGEIYALPLNRIERLLKITKDEILSLEGKPYISNDGNNISLVEGNKIFGDSAAQTLEKQPVVVVNSRNKLYGLKVDKFIGERELVIRPLDERLGKVRNISSVIVLEDSRLALVIDIDDVVTSLQSLLHPRHLTPDSSANDANTKASTILIIDDSPTVRQMERKILERAGFLVQTAVDGVDGWIKARSGQYDLIISDIDMPRMNGIELVRNLRATPEGRELPIMLVSYKDRDEDKQAGIDAGANIYMNKGGFNDCEFIRKVTALINGEYAR